MMSENPFSVTLKYMEIIGMYLPVGRSKCWFVFYSVVLKPSAVIIVLGGCLLHLFKVTTENITEVDISEDFLILICATCIFIMQTTFSIRYTEWDMFLKDVVHLNKFKKSTKFSDLVRSGNKFSKMCVVYVLFGSSVYGLIDFKLKAKCCTIKEEHHLKELLCGMFFPFWLPFPLPRYFLPALYMAQYISTAAGLLSGAMVVVLNWEAARIIGFYIDQLNAEFETIFKQDSRFTNDKLRKWVQHHNQINELIKRLNMLSKRSIGYALFISAAVCGCGLNMMMKAKLFGGLFFLCGWYSGAFIFCHAGQLINDKSGTIYQAVYSSSWHRSNAKTQKDVLFILMRSQRQYCIQLFPFGIANYALFATMLRASYSYLMMLKGT